MNVYTLNIGQGQFVVVTGKNEAFIIDTYVPLDPKHEIVHVKAALAKILKGKELLGLIVTGFDSDHFNEVGMKIVLNKYRPKWIMYPKYFKKTKTADACFEAIETFESASSKFARHSVSLQKNDHRFYGTISSEFTFEVFSPHVDDMNSSNNCSLVCKIVEKSIGASYLVTGDAECQRWDSMVKHFGNALQSQVLAAPHHGSRNGVTESAIKLIKPHTVIVSAGISNEYQHPHAEATKLFTAHADKWYQTNYGTGQSLRTEISSAGISTYKFKPD
jgi:beta-lactamase superfamily II metal-dependent hydrolase